MKRLLFTVTTDLNYDQRMIRICGTLSKDYEVLLIGRERRKSLQLHSRQYEQKRIKCFSEKGKLFYIEYNLRLFIFLLFQPCDLICGIDLDTALSAKIAARLRRKIFVYDAHELFTETPEVVRRPAVKRIWQKIESLVLRGPIAAYTVGPALARVFNEKYNQDFEVIANISTLKSKSKMDHDYFDGEEYAVYAGAVNEGRGIELLIDIYSKYDKNLLICGDGDVLEACREQVTILRCGHRIKFTGYMVPELLDTCISGARFGYLILENKGLSYYFSLANKFFDYIHCHIPQVCIDFPEYRSRLNEHRVGLAVNYDRQEVLAASKSLWEDETLYEQLKANTETAAREWNWQKESKKLIGFYHKLFQE